MNAAQFLRRIGTAVMDEQRNPEGWWYLSFADENGFLGGAVVRGRGPVTAMLTARSFGIDPLGQVMAIPADPPPAPQYRNRLMNLDECKIAWPEEGMVDLKGDAL